MPAAGSLPLDSEPHAVSAAVTGLSPASIYHYRLVATNAIGEAVTLDHAFTTGPVAPLIEKESVESVGTAEATLAAKINPRGGQTTYRVEYGATSAYGQSTAQSAPFGFPSDNHAHSVSVHVTGLQPGSAYHFRFLATNEVGGAEGADTAFGTYPATSPSFAPCANDGFRTGTGARLPDCRAYEQATPIEKHGANAQIGDNDLGVSASGDRVTFFLNGGAPTTGGSSSLYPFLGSRGPGGWSTDGLLPLTRSSGQASVIGVNEDLSAALVKGEGPGGSGEQLFIRDSETASYEPGPIAPEFRYGSTRLIGFAADPEHVAFLSREQLLPEAAAERYNPYDLDHGALSLADRVPAGSETSCDDEAGPACEAAPGGVSYSSGVSSRVGELKTSTISRDGSRLFFTTLAPGASVYATAGRIYLREDGARTAWVSASQRTAPDPNGEKTATLQDVTPDGSKAFFLSCEKLTDDSTAVSTAAASCTGGFEPEQGQDLYSYDAETGKLTDLTVDSHGDPLGAAVRKVLGASEDGSYVYFAAAGVLAPGASPSPSCERNSQPRCNLYVYHDGVTTFIANPSDAGNLTYGGGTYLDSRVSASGQALLFGDEKSLTGYDNSCPTGPFVEKRCIEFFRYSAPEEKLLCVTCQPTGLPPSANATLANNITGFVAVTGGAWPGLSRNISANGNRVFFNSLDPLVPGDTNGSLDVYEWEAKGEGSCESEGQDGGCIYLISGGTEPHASGFLGASENGDHVFFFTQQQLVPTDQDQLYDVYDASVGGGLAAQHALSPPTCTSAACQANPTPPAEQTPASATFQGPGNAKPKAAGKARKCPKGKRKARRGGKVRCVRKRHRKRHHKHHKRHAKRHHKRANVNRGGSK